MSRTSKALKRLGVAGLVVVTIGALVPALTGTAEAAAGPVTTVTLTPPTATAPAGTCVQYTVNAQNAAAANVDTATITVALQEGTTSASSTISASFCNPTTGAAVTSTTNSAGQKTIVVTTNTNGNAVFGVLDAFQTGSTITNNNNETLITAWSDINGNGIRDGEPFDQSTQTTTAAPTNNDVGNGDVSATPVTATNVVGEAHTVTVTVNNGANLAGITVSYVVTGVNPQAAKTCEGGPTNSIGQTTCTYTGLNAGADSIRVFVNQSFAGRTATAGYDDLASGGGSAVDPGEPNAVVGKTWTGAQAARTIDLTCLPEAGDSFLNAETTAEDCVNVLADRNRTFRAIVDTTGTSGTPGTLVRFAVTGGSGDETALVPVGQQTPSATQSDCTTIDYTAGAGDTGTSTTNSYCDVEIADPTPVAGEVLTVTATVRGTSVADSGTLTFRNVPSDARFIAVTPDGGTALSGSVQVFTATVTDANGRPVQGVVVDFTETGAGFLRGATSATTDAAGKATVDATSASTETGDQTVTGTIKAAQETGTGVASVTGPTHCADAVGTTTQPNGQAVSSTTAAGNCSDTGKITWSTTLASPSTSPTSSPGTGGRGTLSTSTPDIQPNIQGVLLASGLTPNSAYELRCYSRPSTTYFTARSATTSATGTSLEFRILPGTNTRCYVRPAGNESLASNSVVINVHTTLSLSAVRTGVRTYIFQGRNLPRRSGQLITLYRVAGGQEIRTSNLVTDASGIYRVTRTFTGTGTFQFRVRTSQTLTNAPGASNVITVNIH